jgi:hypothetical protein
MRTERQVGVDEDAQISDRCGRLDDVTEQREILGWQLMLAPFGGAPEKLCFAGVQL